METLLWKMEAKNGVVYFEDYANSSSFLHHLWKVCLAEYLYVMASIDGFTTFGLPIPGNVMDHLTCIEPTRFWFLQHEQGDFKDLEDLTHTLPSVMFWHLILLTRLPMSGTPSPAHQVGGRSCSDIAIFPHQFAFHVGTPCPCSSL